MLTVAYIALAVLGCAYVLVAVFLGHHGDHAGGDGAHAAAHHESVSYGTEHGGQGTATAGDGAAAGFTFPLFSPLALATLFAAIGAYGLIAKYGFEVSDAASLGIAFPAALATAYAVTYFSWTVVTGSRGSSAIKVGALAGAEGEVLTPIPAGGLGEVAAFVEGQRFTAAAREAGGGALARGTSVVVERMAGSTLVVRARDQRGS